MLKEFKIKDKNLQKNNKKINKLKQDNKTEFYSNDYENNYSKADNYIENSLINENNDAYKSKDGTIVEIVKLREENSKLLAINSNINKKLIKFQNEISTVNKIKSNYSEIVESVRKQEETLTK